MAPALIGIFFIGYGFSRWIVPKVFSVCHRWGYVDHPNERKIQSKAVSYGGGFVVLIGMFFWAFLLVLGECFGLWEALWPQREILPMQLVHSPVAVSVALGLLSMMMLGFCDDLFDLSPKIKLMIQLLITGLVLWWGQLSMSFFVDMPAFGFVCTLLWVVLITNAFNLIDNMDGYCASVALMVLLSHVVLLSLHGHHLVALASAMIMGPVAAFFKENYPPAKMYLGDAGSLSLGFLMAMLSVASTYYHEGQSVASILTPVLMLAIPLFDVCTVMWIRFRHKKPFFVGDRNHFSHRLLSLGLSNSQALLVIMGLSCVTGIGSILLAFCNGFVAILVLAQVMTVLVIVHVLECAGQRFKGTLD